jgi:polysaccharide biosynthesis/export protein
MIRTLFLATIAVPFCCLAQAGSAEPPTNLPAQPLGPNDLISISVYGAPELSRSVRIASDGSLRLPMTSEAIPVSGRMPGELESDIAVHLKREGLLVEPFVTVTVTEYASRPIRVAGAVRRPASFQSYGRVTLLDAIARAEGLAENAGPEILVSRRLPDGGQEQVKRVPVAELIRGTDPSWNLLLKGGEEVLVPEAGRIFVLGNIKKPGAYPAVDGQAVTVLKALAMAEGLTPYSRREAYIYRAAAAGAPPREIPVPLKEIINRRSTDITLQPNDIFYVPDNTSRRLTMQALDRLVSFGIATTSGVLVLGSTR